jgi:extracellular elastinolytic metalloproteinase
MRESKKNTKSSQGQNRYRPVLDNLEDRSMPGNTFLGPVGLDMPLFNKAKTAAPVSLQLNAGKSGKTVTNTSNLSITRAANVSGRVRPSLTSYVLNSALNKLSNSTASLPTEAAAGVKLSFKPAADVSSGDDVLARGTVPSLANNYGLQVTGGGAGFWIANPNTGSSLDAIAGNNSTSSSSTAGSYDSIQYATASPNSVYNLSVGDNGSYDNRGEFRQNTPITTLSANQQAGEAALRETAPDLSFTVDSVFGTVRSVVNTSSPLTGPAAGNPVDIGMNFIRENAAFFGVSTADINLLKLKENVNWSVGGGAIIQVQQYINGIIVDNGSTGIGVRNDGSVVIVNNAMVPNAAASINTSTPAITGKDAIILAALDSGLTVRGGLTSTTPRGTELVPTYLNSSISIDPIPVTLKYLPIGPNQVRLVYNTRIFIPNSTFLFEYNVDAVTGQVWSRNNWIAGDSYRVFKPPIETPAEGGRTLVVNPADPIASRFGWHDTNGRAGAEYNYTRGNNVYARYGPTADPSGGILTGTPAPGGATNTYDFPLNLAQAPSTYANAATTQLFYSTNYYHDVLYRAGWTESAGNYQQNNYGRTQTARQNDPIYAFAQSGWQNGDSDNAYFVPSNDGQIGRVAMFIWTATGPNRDGDLDNQIIFHELTHGSSTRLVGGSTTAGDLSATFEARGLGEGYADYYALLLTLQPTDNKSTRRTVGNYVLGQNVAGNGIRNYPYSYDKAISPYTYADFDPAQSANGDGNGFYSYYTMGEIWANALNDMTLNLVENYGYSTDWLNGNGGNNIALKLVTAGMGLTGFTPNALDARNGVVAADQFLYGGAYQREIWNAMARRGMGVFARAGVPDPDDPDTAPPIPLSIQEDFTEPDYGNVPPPPVPPGGDGSNDNLYEPNQTSNAAFDMGAVTGLNTLEDLQIKQPVPGKAQDRDWFKFTPTKAGVLTLTAEVGASTGDLDVRLYRSVNGSPSNLTEIGVGQGTKRSVGTNEVITVAVGAGITYYFNVGGFNGGWGNYNLLLNAPV